jgi:putative tryptophan/tyrosine transport system ATP-binding protein
MLDLNNVDVTFNPGAPSEVRALREISLHVRKQEFVTVIGANGAGKSTLFNAIAGSVSPERGHITLKGRDITNWSEPRRSAFIGRVFQNPALGTCPGLSVRENLSLSMTRGKTRGLRPGVKRQHEDLFFERVKEVGMGLEHRLDADVGLLSGGQRQAITLIMATLTQPQILLLDEHTAALDPNAAAQILELTVYLARELQLTTVMITHSMQQACDVGDRVMMMNRGQVLFEIAGPERQDLQVSDLVERFRALRTGDALTDRSLLE